MEAVTKAKILEKNSDGVHVLNKVTGLSPITLSKNKIFLRYFQGFH